MSDVLPKLKMYIFLSVIAIFFSFAYILASWGYGVEFDLNAFFGSVGGAFLPFGSTFIIVTTGLGNDVPVLLTAFIGIFTGVISTFQTFIIGEYIYAHIPMVNN